MTQARMVKGLPRVYVWTGRDGMDQIAIGGDCVRLSASKSFGPHGTFSIDILPRTSDRVQTVGDLRKLAKLYQAIKPNAPISIGMERDGGILLGLVDRIGRTRKFGSQVMYGLQITGRCCGKAFTDNLVKATTAVQEYVAFRAKVAAALGADHPLIYDLEGTWGPEDEQGFPVFVGTTVLDVVRWFIDHAPTMNIPILEDVSGGGGKIGDYVTISSTGNISTLLVGDDVTTWNDARIWSEGLHTYQGTIYGFLMGSVLDQDFYECWMDYVPSAGPLPNIVLMIRPKPFDEPALEFYPIDEQTGATWADLRTMVDQKPYHEIGFDEVFSENLGISDADAFSVFKVTGKHSLCGNEQMDAEGLSYPLVCTWNAKKHGVKSYNTSLNLVGANLTKKAAGDEDYTAEVDADIKQFRGRIFNWNRLNSRMETGNIEVMGRDSYRIGDRVRLAWAIPPVASKSGKDDEIGMVYYTVGVSWSWMYGGDYTTSLQLTRGHNDSMITALKEEILADAPATNPDHFAAT